MQGGALGDSHAEGGKGKQSGFVGRANGKTNGWTIYQFGPQNWWSSGAWAWRPMDKCATAGGSSSLSSGTLGAVGRLADGLGDTWWDLGSRKLLEGGRHMAPSLSLRRGEAKSRKRCGRRINIQGLGPFCPSIWACILF